MTEWISLVRLLDTHSIAALASVIEAHGVMVWDRYGRRVEADPAHKGEALQLLADSYAQCNEPDTVDDAWYASGGYDIRELETRLYEFGWSEDKLPDFDAVVASTPPASPSGLLKPTKRKNTWSVAIDAMAQDFYTKHGRRPDDGDEAWHYLNASPPEGFAIVKVTDGLDLLKHFLNKKGFKDRWSRRTCGEC